MQEELKGSLIDTVKSAVDVLSNDDALEIVNICRRAMDTKIADLTEQYLLDSIEGGEGE